MNPIYRFLLTAGGTTGRQVYPVYGNALALDYALEQNQQFYRAKLSGKLTFQGDDYSFIAHKEIDTQFTLRIDISYDRGASWATYWTGRFWKTDCKFDDDNRTAVVTPEVYDRYSDVLTELEREYNLIDLLPVTQVVSMDKRPMIQVYVPGRSVIGCFLSGMWWEQECDAVEWAEKDEEYRLLLEVKYGFAFCKAYVRIKITGNMTPQLPESAFYASSTGNEPRYFRFYTEDGKYLFYRYAVDTYDYIEIQDTENRATWRGVFLDRYLMDKYEVNLTPVGGTTATGTVTIDVEHRAVFARYVTDRAEVPGGVTPMPIPEDDLVPQNRNYHYVLGYQFPSSVWISDRLIPTPTKWGIYQPGQYYTPGVPASAGLGEMYPVSRDAWTIVSVWFTANAFDPQLEKQLRAPALLKHAYPLWSVIQVLLGKVSSTFSVTHEGTTDYSAFLYGPNPLNGITQRILISPKSNLVSLGYDEPAQKAPITLKTVLDMLRDCFRCYWFIDDQYRLRIEHIRYFMLGGRYQGAPEVGVDLTQRLTRPGGKRWAFAANQYEYDKPDLTGRYEFGWMDDVTELFEGYPIDILSNFVNREKIEKIEVQQFTSDVDYIMLNPANVSKDGFVLLSATTGSGSASVTRVMPDTSGYVPIGADTFTFYQGQRYRITANVPNGQPVVFYFEQNGRDFAILTPPNWTVKLDAPVTVQGAWLLCTPAIYGQAITVTVEQLSESLSLRYLDAEFDDTHHVLQNAWVSFWFLQRYYMYDMPSLRIDINGQSMFVYATKKMKTQKVKFPALTDPDLLKLIKTGIGSGQIQKISINLLSRGADATLKFETEPR